MQSHIIKGSGYLAFLGFPRPQGTYLVCVYPMVYAHIPEPHSAQNYDLRVDIGREFHSIFCLNLFESCFVIWALVS